MRELKFKVWDKKRMTLVKTINFFNNIINCGNLPMQYIQNLNFDDCELLQFTGLKDKNGKEIYEGDILYSEIIKWHYVVEWMCGGLFLRCVEEPEYPKTMMIGIDELEIIGNIYENPELMK